MKKNLLILILNIQFIYAQSPVFQWAKQMGGTNYDEINSIATDAAGNVYYTGYFMGIVDLNPTAGVFNVTSAGAQDIFITKLDASGNFVWTKTMGGTSSDYGVFIKVDASGNIYYTGHFAGVCDFDPSATSFTLQSAGNAQYDAVVSKLDNNGNFLWAKNVGGNTADQGYGLDVDASGNVFVTGIFTGTGDFDPSAGTFSMTATVGGLEDMFFLKLNSAGNFVWAKKVGGTSVDESFSIKVDASGNLYATGYFGSTVDFDPNAGTNTVGSAGNYDGFVLKLDNNGNFIWVATQGGTFNDLSRSVALDASGNIYTTGYFSGTADFDPGVVAYNITSYGGSDVYIMQLNPSGNLVWVKRIGGGSSYDESRSIALDANNNVYITGFFDDICDFDPAATNVILSNVAYNDVYLAKYDNSGTYLWAGAIGGNSDEYGSCIALDASFNIYAGGAFKNSPDFDPTTGTYSMTAAGSTGTFDGYIMKMSQTSVTSGLYDLAKSNNVKIYPNPSTNYLEIENTKQERLFVEIMNGFGQTLMNIESNEKNIIFNIEGLSQGLYYVLITNDKVQQSKKIIID